MQIITSWMQTGIEEGLKRGREETLKATSLRLLNKRLGELPEQTEAQIRRLHQGQLENLVEAVLDFQQISDLESWLQSVLEAQN